MPLFDTYVMVDWSASQAEPPKKPKKDAIWWAVKRGRERPAWRDVTTEKSPSSEAQAGGDLDSLLSRIETCVFFERTRDAAINHINHFLQAETKANKRVLVGFDFAFGYPAGFAEAADVVPGDESANARYLWKWLYLRMLNADKEEDRFKVAAELNDSVVGLKKGVKKGPLWGRPSDRHDDPLPPKNPYFDPDRKKPPSKVEEEKMEWPEGDFKFRIKRRTDEVALGAKTVWQLFGRGAVGSQVLLGVPYLHDLQERLSTEDKRCVIWPLDGIAISSRRPQVVIVEIYPSLIATGAGKQMPDRYQVIENAIAFDLLDARGDLKSLFDLKSLPDDIRRQICQPIGGNEYWEKMSEKERDERVRRVVREEGWILGAGRDEMLRSVAKEDSPLYRLSSKR